MSKIYLSESGESIVGLEVHPGVQALDAGTVRVQTGEAGKIVLGAG